MLATGNKPLQLQASSAAEAREWSHAMQEKKTKLKEQVCVLASQNRTHVCGHAEHAHAHIGP